MTKLTDIHPGMTAGVLHLSNSGFKLGFDRSNQLSRALLRLDDGSSMQISAESAGNASSSQISFIAFQVVVRTQGMQKTWQLDDLTVQTVNKSIDQFRAFIGGSVQTTSDVAVHLPVQDRPLAAAGLASYRAANVYGWIMVGATDDNDALVQARRSAPSVEAADLQRWNGQAYEPLLDAAAESLEVLELPAP